MRPQICTQMRSLPGKTSCKCPLVHGDAADAHRLCSVADLDTMIDYADLLENHDIDAAGALECYRRAESMPLASVDLRILAPFARLLHHQSGEVDQAIAIYRRALVICADALALALEPRTEHTAARANLKGSGSVEGRGIDPQDEECG